MEDALSIQAPRKETKIPASAPLTPGEIASFQALVKPAIVLLLLLRLERPAGARELADILGLDEHTVAKYLRILARLELVSRTSFRGGYILAADRGALFGGELTVNKLQIEPVTTNRYILNQEKKEDLLTAVDADSRKDPAFGKCSEEAVKTLCSLGIGEPKRSSLARLDYITVEYILAWHHHLGYVKGEDYRTGLLIHVLETGDPAPEVNELGHPLDCECSQCNPIICPKCHCYPCPCLDSDESM